MLSRLLLLGNFIVCHLRHVISAATWFPTNSRSRIISTEDLRWKHLLLDVKRVLLKYGLGSICASNHHAGRDTCCDLKILLAMLVLLLLELHLLTGI